MRLTHQETVCAPALRMRNTRSPACSLFASSTSPVSRTRLGMSIAVNGSVHSSTSASPGVSRESTLRALSAGSGQRKPRRSSVCSAMHRRVGKRRAAPCPPFPPIRKTAVGTRTLHIRFAHPTVFVSSMYLPDASSAALDRAVLHGKCRQLPAHLVWECFRAMRRLAIAACLILVLPLVGAQAQLRGHGGPVRTLAIAPHGKTAISGSFDQTAVIWSLGRDAAAPVLRFPHRAGNSLAVLPDRP